MSISQCQILELPKITDNRGNLTFIEENRHVPFDIKRIYYLYDIPGGESRGGHAHKKLHQFLVALSGTFDVVLDDGFQRKTFSLNRAYNGLLIVPGIWRELNNFSTGSVCLVLASELYDHEDYIYKYEDFVQYIRGLGE